MSTCVTEPRFGHRQLCLHVGLPKSGSTTLQKRFFSVHPAFTYLGVRYVEGRPTFVNAELEELFDRICDRNVPYEKERVVHLYRTEILPRFGEGKIVAVSDENLAFGEKGILGRKIDRMKAIFGEAKIVLVIRRQTDMLESRYIHVMRGMNAGHVDFMTYPEWVRKNYINGEVKVRLYHLDYFDMAEMFSSAFEKKNVGVFLLEELNQNPEDFESKLRAFLRVSQVESRGLLVGGRENVRISHREFLYNWAIQSWPALRRLRDVLPKEARSRVRRFIQTGRKATVPTLPEDVRMQVDALCAPGNRKLQELWGLDLARYGYRLGGEPP